MHNVQKCMQSKHPMNPVNLTACGLTTLGKVVGLMACNVAVSLSTSVGLWVWWQCCTLQSVFPPVAGLARCIAVLQLQSQWIITGWGFGALQSYSCSHSGLSVEGLVHCSLTAAVPVGYHQLRVWCIAVLQLQSLQVIISWGFGALQSYSCSHCRLSSVEGLVACSQSCHCCQSYCCSHSLITSVLKLS